MIKKRGVWSRGDFKAISIVSALVLLLAILPPQYLYSNEIFKKEFIKDDFNIINGSAIKFSDIGIEVGDFLLINGLSYKIDKERIEGILIKKESTKNGTKIVYWFRNEGEDKEIQFMWKSYIPLKYNSANNFDLNRDFITKAPVVKFYSNDKYEYYMAFEDVKKAFGGVTLSYNADTRTLTAYSDMIKLKKNKEIVMDPEAGTDIIAPLIEFVYPTPLNGTKKEENYAEIKINVTEANLDNFVWNWNGTNYTFYFDNLVLMMNLNNVAVLGESNFYAKDSSGYENYGTIYGATYAEGRHGYGLEFDGYEDYLNIGDASSLDLDVFSVEFWFKPDKNYEEGSDYVSFFYDDDYEIYMENGNMVFDYKGNKINSSTNVWNKDEWYHILATYDGVQTIYVNGLKENSVIVAAPFTVKNNAGKDVAFFLNSGDIVLKGDCNAGSCSYPGDDAFIIQDDKSNTVAYIDNKGDLCIEDMDCNDNDANCDNPGDGFIVKSAHDKIVSYINSEGDLCLIGDLIENGIS